MTIILKNKGTLHFKDFKFKCCIGKKGLTKKKLEGDKKTPKGIFTLGNLYYRKNKNTKPITKLKCIKITREMGWCNDTKNKKYYNKLIKVNKKIKHEKLYRNDYKYNYFIPINFNTKKSILGKGSAIFIHLTKNFKPTAGCIAIQKKDFLILIKLINKKTKIKIS
tara:strand:+ start:40 stop:534 length:495 start_codon:yes stop_codon:yes gene_type:complete